MSEERGKSVWVWIVGLLIGMPTLYFASFGPACWITTRMSGGSSVIPFFYQQPMSSVSSSSERLAVALRWYAVIGAADGWYWVEYPSFWQDNGTVSFSYEWRWRQPDFTPAP